MQFRRRAVPIGVFVLSALVISGASQSRQGPAMVGVGGMGAGSGAPVVSHAGESRLDSQLAQVAQSSKLSGATAAIDTARSQNIDVEHGLVRVVVDAKAGRDAASEA